MRLSYICGWHPATGALKIQIGDRTTWAPAICDPAKMFAQSPGLSRGDLIHIPGADWIAEQGRGGHTEFHRRRIVEIVDPGWLIDDLHGVLLCPYKAGAWRGGLVSVLRR